MKTDEKQVAHIESLKRKTENEKCHAPDASDDGKRSSGIGGLLLIGQSVRDELTLLLKNSERQQKQINDMTQGIEYLAQQVKTLVDALAEDSDPDAPLTTYMDGRPI